MVEKMDGNKIKLTVNKWTWNKIKECKPNEEKSIDWSHTHPYFEISLVVWATASDSGTNVICRCSALPDRPLINLSSTKWFELQQIREDSSDGNGILASRAATRCCECNYWMMRKCEWWEESRGGGIFSNKQHNKSNRQMLFRASIRLEAIFSFLLIKFAGIGDISEGEIKDKNNRWTNEWSVFANGFDGVKWNPWRRPSL